MGLFDTVKCEYPLPNPAHQDLKFQTKDLDCWMGRYTITCDGKLVRHPHSGGKGPERDIEWPIHGDIRIYDFEPENEKELVEYTVRFTHGRVERIRRSDRSERWVDQPPVESKPPLPEEGGSEGLSRSDRPAEVALLKNLRLHEHELHALLEASTNHWGYEDPIYRFYHQSFKVFVLQEQTKAIVDSLSKLAPERPLNPWFLEIIEEGTGKTFKQEDNAEWARVTRPILEAFFHARFFLEMAARYARLEEPPDLPPSGYAALLYLYGLR